MPITPKDVEYLKKVVSVAHSAIMNQTMYNGEAEDQFEALERSLDALLRLNKRTDAKTREEVTGSFINAWNALKDTIDGGRAVQAKYADNYKGVDLAGAKAVIQKVNEAIEDPKKGFAPLFAQTAPAVSAPVPVPPKNSPAEAPSQPSQSSHPFGSEGKSGLTDPWEVQESLEMLMKEGAPKKKEVVGAPRSDAPEEAKENAEKVEQAAPEKKAAEPRQPNHKRHFPTLSGLTWEAVEVAAKVMADKVKHEHGGELPPAKTPTAQEELGKFNARINNLFAKEGIKPFTKAASDNKPEADKSDLEKAVGLMKEMQKAAAKDPVMFNALVVKFLENEALLPALEKASNFSDDYAHFKRRLENYKQHPLAEREKSVGVPPR